MKKCVHVSTVLGSHCTPCVWCGYVCVRLGVGVSFVALCGMIICVCFCVVDRESQTQKERCREGEGDMERVRERLHISPRGVSHCHCTMAIVHIKKRKKKRKRKKIRKDEIKKSSHRAHIIALLPREAKRWPSAHAWEPNASICSNPIHSEQCSPSHSAADVR